MISPQPPRARSSIRSFASHQHNPSHAERVRDDHHQPWWLPRRRQCGLRVPELSFLVAFTGGKSHHHKWAKLWQMIVPRSRGRITFAASRPVKNPPSARIRAEGTANPASVFNSGFRRSEFLKGAPGDAGGKTFLGEASCNRRSGRVFSANNQCDVIHGASSGSLLTGANDGVPHHQPRASRDGARDHALWPDTSLPHFLVFDPSIAVTPCSGPILRLTHYARADCIHYNGPGAA